MYSIYADNWKWDIKFLESFLFFWSITMLVSYHIVDMNHVISIYDFITIIANAISYAVFYGITFTTAYCLKKVK